MNYSDLPPEEPLIPSPEERLQNFAEAIRLHRENLHWESQIRRILGDLEDFLSKRPPPPPSWQKRFDAQGRDFDYWQVVLPGEYTDPYTDDLENVRLLTRKFQGRAYMALESELVTRNHFIYGNGHALPIELPEPLLMLESDPRSQEVDWDCYMTIYPDGSWTAYNLDRDDEESLGEDFLEVLDRWMPVLAKLRLVIPRKGRDYGLIGPQTDDE